MNTIIDGISFFYKCMDGIACPKCGKTSKLISTTNEWKYHCVPCDIRFKHSGEILENNS